MIIVVIILGLIAGMVISRGPVRSNTVDLEATVRALTGALRLARGQAIADDRTVTVRTGADGFTVGNAAPWRAGRGQTLSAATVIFTPEGQSSGGVIDVASGDRLVAVSIDWLTGRVYAQPVGSR